MQAEKATYFPDYELVVVLAAERCQILFVSGERETLDENLVELESMDHLQSVEVPNDDVGLHREKRKFQSDLNLFSRF